MKDYNKKEDCNAELNTPDLCFPYNYNKFSKDKSCEDRNDCDFSKELLIDPSAEPIDKFKTPVQYKVSNDRIEVSCSEGLYGDNAIVEEGELELFTYDPNELSDLKIQVNEEAQSLAESRLTCYFGNDEIILTCESGVGGSVYIPANKILSLESKEDANNRARSMAESQLVCTFYNERIELYCDDDKDGQLALENENNPIIVESGEFQSTESQEAANALAMEYAQSMLQCQWGNDKMSMDCPNGSFLQDGSSSVVIEANTYLSDISKEDANNLANQDLLSQLACTYSNDEVILECDDDIYEKASSTPVVVPAGTFTSSESKEDANNLAQSYAESMLICAWGNDDLPKLKCPSGVDYAIEQGGEAIPANTYISYTSKEDANNIASIAQQATLICISEDQIGGGGGTTININPDGGGCGGCTSTCCLMF